MLDPGLMALLVCPACKGRLEEKEGAGGPAEGPELVCDGCGRRYPVRNGIPILLVEEARRDE